MATINIVRLQSELEVLRKELQSAPKGKLAKKGSTFYQLVGDKYQGITKKPELIQQLCRKKYVQVRIGQLEKNLSKSLSAFDSSSPKELIKNLKNPYQSLPLEYFYHGSIADWKDKIRAKNSLNPEQVKYVSAQKGSFRSMAERMIAEMLDSYGIPYHYDSVLNFGYKSVSPDFLIKNPFTGKTYIWEHFGAFNQEKYADSMNDKLSLYMEEGYIPFENFIYTFECHLRNPKRVKELIQQIIL